MRIETFMLWHSTYLPRNWKLVFIKHDTPQSTNQNASLRPSMLNHLPKWTLQQKLAKSPSPLWTCWLKGTFIQCSQITFWYPNTGIHQLSSTHDNHQSCFLPNYYSASQLLYNNTTVLNSSLLNIYSENTVRVLATDSCLLYCFPEKPIWNLCTQLAGDCENI